ncbi:hypothetical protein Bca4012_063778 [Brassica carinata]
MNPKSLEFCFLESILFSPFSTTKRSAVNRIVSVEEECPSTSAANGFDGGEKVKQEGKKGSQLSKRHLVISGYLCATGDVPFDPHSGGNYDRHEDHLALMMKLFGMMPHKEAATPGIYSTDGDLLHIRRLRFWSMNKVLTEKYEIKRDKKKKHAYVKWLRVKEKDKKVGMEENNLEVEGTKYPSKHKNQTDTSLKRLRSLTKPVPVKPCSPGFTLPVSRTILGVPEPYPSHRRIRNSGPRSLEPSLSPQDQKPETQLDTERKKGENEEQEAVFVKT